MEKVEEFFAGIFSIIFGVNCGCIVLIGIFNLALGGWSVNYLIHFFTNDKIPFLAAALIGLFAGELSIPGAIIVAILRMFGVV
jgi:hypothetical protein